MPYPKGEHATLDIIPHILIAHAGMIAFVSCAEVFQEEKKRKKYIKMGGGGLNLVRSHKMRKGERIRGFNLVTNDPPRLGSFTKVAPDSKSSGIDDTVSRSSCCAISVDTSGRVEFFTMPHLSRLFKEKDEEKKEEEGEDELGTMCLPSPLLTTRPACIRSELGMCIHPFPQVHHLSCFYYLRRKLVINNKKCSYTNGGVVLLLLFCKHFLFIPI